MAPKNRMWCIGRFEFVVLSLLLFSLATTGVSEARNPLPLINQPLMPDAVKPGGAGFTLTVNGIGFVSGAVVKWNGSPRATTFVSRSRLKATVLSSDIIKPSTAAVTVVNPVPGGGTSNIVYFPIRASSSSALFSTSTYSAGSVPWAVATGDFNGDGKLDLAVTNNTDNTVTIFTGNGNGIFKALGTAATGQTPQGITAADFNGDGKLDLAVANDGSGTVSILLGRGDGTFQMRTDYSTGPRAQTVAVGDFNRDGKLDLAVANYGPDYENSTVSILLGNGDGTFRPQVAYSAGVNPVGVLVGDFNGDGKLDLAVLDNNQVPGVSILLGNGDGTFQNPVPYNVGENPRVGMVADFNGDGKLDLAVANYTDNDVSILLGNGDGSFQAPVNYVVGANPNALTGADLNRDGKLDLVTANQTGNSVSVLLGNGDGTFQVHNDYPTGQGPGGIAVGDFNADGRLDVALADSSSDTVSVLLQAPTVSVPPTSLIFAGQVIGTNSTAQQVTLTNSLHVTLNIASISVTGTNATDFSETNKCPSSLAVGASCTIEVTFAPTQIGPRTATITITDNALDSPQSVALSGTGVISGWNIILSTNSLTFATQLVGTTSTAQSVTLTNYGSLALLITSISFKGANPGDFIQTNTCGGLVASGASCTISVSFKPMQGGTRVAALSIADNAPGSPQTISVTGVGTVVELNPTSLGFGAVPVGQSKSMHTKLTNWGSTTLSITGKTITGAFSEENNCGSSVGAEKSCTITVTFKPGGRGIFRGVFSVSDSGGGSPQQVSLSGSGCVYNVHHKCQVLISSPAVQSALARSRTTAVPSATGVNRVGTRLLDLVDSSRTDPFAANGIKRELLVRFWYPAAAHRNCKLAAYTSRRVWNYFDELTRVPLPAVTTNSCLNAPVAEGNYPVVVFTHGYTGTFTDYTFLFEDLASRGYVVASIDHTYEATAVEFPDGRFVKSAVGSHLAGTWRTDDRSLSFALSVRLDDLRFVLNELERLNASADNPFAGKLDMSKVALAGHSLGGLTTWQGVQQDTRFKAGILLDPYLGNASLGAIETPVMVLTMRHEQQNDDECELWSDLLGPRLAVNLRGAEHVTPSDLVWLAKGAIKAGTMGPDKAIAAIRDYVAAFLDTNLLGKPSVRLLTGPSSDYPDAAITTRGESLCRGSTGN